MHSLEINPEITVSRISKFIVKRIDDAKANGVIIGLSGGIDSSVTAALCVRALGHEKTFGLLMPTQTTQQQDIDDAIKSATLLGVKYAIEDISPSLNAFKQFQVFDPERKIVNGNLATRFRMGLLYYYANLHNWLVIGTGNKSELLVGYFTKFGDGGCDILPLGDLFKCQVRQLAEYLDIPPEIIKKAPSAGLWPGQTDESELGISYNDLDIILSSLEQLMTPDEISKEFNIPLEIIKKVEIMLRKSQHKRIGPMVFKMGSRTPGFDWRLSIISGET
ncbi:NAD+ synthase [Candidatus Borrarchaeum sp.]|uniref:NAD+ synthase n=1 Tax=Candidatus Borrarchaeum sp. TaxID=2846742 RepID=UPI00257C86C0|nr:NAD+ synthase [Candidatus Borrarchaeum sp.]